MKKFEVGKTYKTIGSGEGMARVICTDRQGSDYPILALVKNQVTGGEIIRAYNEYGVAYGLGSSFNLVPEVEKREGWINVYPSDTNGDTLHYSENAADRVAHDHRIACVRVEYEF